jgi:hypothetical protein
MRAIVDDLEEAKLRDALRSSNTLLNRLGNVLAKDLLDHLMKVNVALRTTLQSAERQADS